MGFPKNFSDDLKTPILQNADGLLFVLEYILEFKIAAPDKFSKAAVLW